MAEYCEEKGGVVINLDTLASRDNLNLALKRLHTAPGGWYKNFYRQEMYCFNIASEKYLDALSKELTDKIYDPKPAYKVYVPKEDGFLRPITIISFDDMLIYQAIINVVAEAFYEDLKPYYNTIVFGNHYNGDSNKKNKIFFFAKWQKQWKKFRMRTEKHWDKGFKYLATFDLALFYETIDHRLLGNIIKQNNVDPDVIEILLCQLKTWVVDEERGNGDKVELEYLHGIPQGPIGSAFLAEVYLHYVDVQMKKLMYERKDFFYLRYADDIRILAKSYEVAEKVIIDLSMLCRDLGLVPNTKKTTINFYQNKWELDQQNKMISKIGDDYYKRGELSKRQNKKITKKIIDMLSTEETEMVKQCSCTREEDFINPNKSTSNKSIDRTLLKFALFRIEPNEEVRDLLIANFDRLHFLSDEVCHYLTRCFSKDELVLEWAEKLIIQERPIYEYPQAMLLKHFRGDLFLPEYCWEIITNDKVHWLVRYYACSFVGNEKDLALICEEKSNPFIYRRLLFLKYECLTDGFAKRKFLQTMLKSEDRAIALLGVCIAFENREYVDLLGDKENLSPFLNAALHNLHTNMLAKDLKEKNKIDNADKFFSEDFWSEEELKLLNEFYFSAKHNWEPYPYTWIVSIDSINHLVTDKIFRIEKYNYSDTTEYDNMLKFKNFKEDYPETHYCFKKIHTARNQKGAHPFAAIAQPAKLLKREEQKPLWEKELKALKEIINKNI